MAPIGIGHGRPIVGSDIRGIIHRVRGEGRSQGLRVNRCTAETMF